MRQVILNRLLEPVPYLDVRQMAKHGGKGPAKRRAVIYALRDLFIRFFGKEVEALRAFFIEGGRANAENQNHPIVRKIEP